MNILKKNKFKKLKKNPIFLIYPYLFKKRERKRNREEEEQ
jgi:hypothetical protein